MSALGGRVVAASSCGETNPFLLLHFRKSLTEVAKAAIHMEATLQANQSSETADVADNCNSG